MLLAVLITTFYETCCKQGGGSVGSLSVSTEEGGISETEDLTD